jgi:hypothetical protein
MKGPKGGADLEQGDFPVMRKGERTEGGLRQLRSWCEDGGGG